MTEYSELNKKLTKILLMLEEQSKKLEELFEQYKNLKKSNIVNIETQNIYNISQ